MLNSDDLKLFQKGKLLDAYDKLGAHCTRVEENAGVHFATWAPGARSTSVVGDFCDWDGRRHPMRKIGSGVWGLFIPGIGPGIQYKFEIQNRETGDLVIKTDPYARAFLRPANTNALVVAPSGYQWNDRDWLARRRSWRWQQEPLNIYEVHLGSWRRAPDGGLLPYEQLAAELCAYARDLHYTHVELLPIFEHPLDESLGYQVTGYYAPTSRFGTPDQFRAFVDHCHGSGIGVILDWVPLHFPKDHWALAEFDGGALYERDDPTMAEHPHYHTLIFNYGRAEVRNFLLSNVLYWLKEFHVDGLRVDAVTSMLYLDDARGAGFWKTNALGGRENLQAIKFLREMNSQVGELMPDAFMIAEESTDWPQVSGSARRGGLGFSMKWNMGWVTDTLRFMALPWTQRAEHHRDLTFERLYGETEKFVLAFSHDEVMPTNGSLFERMHGNEREKLAGLRLLFAFQATYPGKKLNFMGNEFGQRQSWNVKEALHWDLLSLLQHRGIARLAGDLNGLYASMSALHAGDFEAKSFRWIEADDATRSTISYLRSFGDAFVVVVLNFSPLPLAALTVGVPRPGKYKIVFDSDAQAYGGSGATSLLSAASQPTQLAGFDQAIRLSLAPLSGAIIELA